MLSPSVVLPRLMSTVLTELASVTELAVKTYEDGAFHLSVLVFNWGEGSVGIDSS